MPQLSEAPPNLSSIDVKERHRLLEAAVKCENEKRAGSVPEIQIIDRNCFINHTKNIDIDDCYKNSRYQLIVRSDNHYTAVDFDKRDGKTSLIILDAANDFRSATLCYSALKNATNVVYASGFSWDVTNSLQKDTHSCSMFSLDHCVQLSQTDSEFHKHVTDIAKPNQGEIRWDDLPPNFIWNAQSTKILDKYQEKMRDSASLNEPLHNGLSYNEYITQGICSYPDSSTQATVTRNESINVHVLKPVMEQKNPTVTMRKEIQALQHYQLENEDLGLHKHN